MARRVRLILGPLLAALVLFTPLSAGAYALYGYEDEYGLVHLNEERINDKFVLLYEGPSDPKLGFAAIKKLIKDKGGAAKELKTDWIAQVVKPFGRLPGTGGNFRYPEVLQTGPIVDFIKDYSRACNLDPELIYAVVEHESRFTNYAVSPKGAAGLMQLMPATSATYGITNPFNPALNVAVGTRFLKDMIVRFKDLRLALAAYNAGPEKVARCGGIPPIPETVTYVERVMTRYAMLKEQHPGLTPKKTTKMPPAAGRG